MAEFQFDRRRLQKLMDEYGYVDADLAELSRVSKSTIYYLRIGKHKSTSPENLARIAVALNTTVDYLLGKSGDDEGRVPVLLPDSIRQLAQIAGRLSEVRQEELIRIAAALEELEREQPIYALPARLMEVLLEVAGAIEIEDESLDELENLLRGQTPGVIRARLIDLGPVEPYHDLGQK